ncbi:VWA domain-containing protein [Staphylococcus aureus]
MIDQMSWSNLKNFIKNFIEGFLSVNPNGVRIGFITYNSSKTVTQFSFGQYSSESSVLVAIDSLRFNYGGNDGNPTNALNEAKALFTHARDEQKTLFLFLDQQVTSDDASSAASDRSGGVGITKAISICSQAEICY